MEQAAPGMQGAEPLSREALAVLFEPANFRAFQKPGCMSHYWAPLIGVFAGARRNEIFFLTPHDVGMQAGVLVFRFNAPGERGAGPQPAGRIVPVHPVLVQLGLLDFIDQRRRTHPDERLFSEYKAGREQAGVPFSRAFVQWVKATAARLPDDRKHLLPDDVHFPSLRALFLAEAAKAGMSEQALRTMGAIGGDGPVGGPPQGDDLALAETLMRQVDVVSRFPTLYRYDELMRSSADSPSTPAPSHAPSPV